MNFREKVKHIVEETKSPDEIVANIRAQAKGRELTDDERTEIVAQAGRKSRLKKSSSKGKARARLKSKRIRKSNPRLDLSHTEISFREEVKDLLEADEDHVTLYHPRSVEAGTQPKTGALSVDKKSKQYNELLEKGWKPVKSQNESSNHPFYQRVKALSKNKKSQSIHDSIAHPYYEKVKVLLEAGFLGKIGRGVANVGGKLMTGGMLGLQALKLGRFETEGERAEGVRQDMAKRKEALEKSPVGVAHRQMKQRHERERALAGTGSADERRAAQEREEWKAKEQKVALDKAAAGQRREREDAQKRGRRAIGRADPRNPTTG